MPVPVSLRAPIVPLNNPTSAQISINENFLAENSLRLHYTGDESDGLRLNPMFPGRLAFKPVDNSIIPLDPLASTVPPLLGHLFLSISTYRQTALRRKEPSFNYPLLLVYHNVVLNNDFFQGTVLSELTKRSGNGYKKILINGQRLNTAAEICHAFAAGALDVMLYGRHDHTFPLVPPGVGGNERAIDLTLGVRTHFNPYKAPPRMTQLAEAELLDPAHFVPMPVSYFLERLRQLSDWDEIVHDDFQNHPFWTAVEQSSPGYRRLRLFLPGERPDSCKHVKAFDELELSALEADGSAAWTQTVNRLGDLFLDPDEIQGRQVAIEFDNLPIALSTDPDGTGSSETYPWPTINSPSAAQSSDLDLTLSLSLAGDPLTQTPLIPLHLKLRDIRGLTVDRGKKEVVAEWELVRKLQEELEDLGWAPPIVGRYGPDTKAVVKDFQRQALTTDRLNAQGTVDPDTVTPWVGEVTGKADISTLTEMLVWRQNDYRTAVSDKLWDVTHRWDDQVGSSGVTYAANYNDWITQHINRFNNVKYMCNWFPIRLLIEYAAAHGLRIKLKYWTPTNNPAKAPVKVHHSHSGHYLSKRHFYRRTKSTVTSRMIAELNSVPIASSERKIGDFINLERTGFTWHTYVISDLLGGSTCQLQYGNMNPAVIPAEIPEGMDEHMSIDSLDDIRAAGDKPYEESFRRWDFASFD